MMNHRHWLVILSTAVIVLCVLASIAGSYALSLHAIHQSDRKWCRTLTILTYKPYTRPADPKRQPAAEAVYELYTALIELEHDYRC